MTVVVIQWCVYFLLLLGARSLCGHNGRLARLAVAALAGGIHSLLCMVPGTAFLAGIGWHLLCLLLTGTAAFGLKNNRWYAAVLFCVLTLALEGAVMGNGGAGSLLWAGALCLVCLLCALCRREQQLLVPVELRNGDRLVRLTALRDTGNQLRDPITGSSVMVICPEAAGRLTGLTPAQLQDPLMTIQSCPGLRLIPYRTVGCENGFLLGMFLKDMMVGTHRCDGVVAFAPEGLGMEDRYQALTGGYL